MPTTTINVDTLNVLYINTAEKSFFDSAFGQVVGGALSALGGDAVSLALNVLFGVPSDPDAAMLTNISNKLATLSGQIGAVSMTTNYQAAVLNVENQINGMYTVMTNNPNASTLTSTEATDLVTFISPGAGAANYTDYSSCIDNLLNVAYGVAMAEMIAANTAKTTCSMGNNSNCYAYAINQNLLTSPIGIYDYVTNHTNLASTVAGLILGICVAANKVYEYLQQNASVIAQQFASSDAILVSDLEKALQNTQMQANISNEQAATFIPILLSQPLATAPSTLCGTAFSLICAMVYNSTSPATPDNVNIRISNSNGFISPDGNHGTYWTMQYNNGSQYWWPSFVNNTPGNIVNIAGPNGGYLGFAPAALVAYVYEFISASDNWPNVQPNTPVPTVNYCQWQMLVKNNNGTMVYMFLNECPGNLALANNHSAFESTQPGEYGFDQNNPDQFWNVTMEVTL